MKMAGFFVLSIPFYWKYISLKCIENGNNEVCKTEICRSNS